MTDSVYAAHAPRYIEHGLSVIPIAPNSKKPGAWTLAHGWRGLSDWTRFSERLPTEIEVDHWSEWPDAGIGLTLGKLSGLVVLDRDYDVPNVSEPLNALIPHSPISKRGQKGWNRIYRYNGERSIGFDVQGQRVLDILSDGRQTVLPPTLHPSGCNYVWTGGLPLLEFLDRYGIDDIPTLPDDFVDQVEALLAKHQTHDDRKFQRRVSAPKVDSDAISSAPSIQAEYFRDVNRTALADLDAWVPKLVPSAEPSRDGYRAVATWRAAENANVGIHPNGIKDWGGDYGMTPIDLVMHATGHSIMEAVECLRTCLRMSEPEPIVFAPAAATTPAPPPGTPKPLPWQKMTQEAPLYLPPRTSTVAAPALPGFIARAPGMLGEIANWITETAPKPQPELALGAALALAATCTQRLYRSDRGNFTSLYVVITAKSTEGKEHPQACVERALTTAGLINLVGGSGYTSSGAVFSALIQQPSHIAIIDEMGKLLKQSRAQGNANSEAAIDKLVEAFGKLDGVIRSPIYSSMTMSKAQASEAQTGARIIHNPAITMLGASTPGTFYGSLTDDLVQDGFLGRLLVFDSTQPRQLIRPVDPSPPPQRIIDWMVAVACPPREGNLEGRIMSEIPASTLAMRIDPSCNPMLQAFELELNRLKDQFEHEKLDVLLGRTYEKALRIAMIVAKSLDVGAHRVMPEHLAWAIELVRHVDMSLLTTVRRDRVRNAVDGDMKKVVAFIKGARAIAADKKNAKVSGALNHGWMPHSMVLKRMHMKARDFQSLIDTMVDAAVIEKANTSDLGYPGWSYRAVAED